MRADGRFAAQIELFKPQDLSMTALSFARAEICDKQLFEAISAAEVRKIGELQPQESGSYTGSNQVLPLFNTTMSSITTIMFLVIFLLLL